MNLLKDKIKNLFLRYLCLSIGSALISSIYSIVDMIMVGKYEGSNGIASLAVVAPLWNIIYSLGLLTGIGGSVLFLNSKTKNEKTYNQYFTVSLILSVVLSILTWICFIFFEKPLLTFFGADETLYELAKIYIKPIKFVLPLYLFNQMLAAYLRNDNDPSLATIGILSGGIFNIIGDYVFVFTFDMGIFGAGLATAIGSFISFVVLLMHFFKKKNSLKIVKVNHLFKKSKDVIAIGFPTCFIDLAMGIITILFNTQIMKYLDSYALSVYGIIIQISTFVQCLSYAIGQASQPIISANYSVNNNSRIKSTLIYALMTSFILGIIVTIFSMLCPNLFVKIFMKPDDYILSIAPSIIRSYSISFILLPFNIYLTYYFQAIMKKNVSFVLSILRGFVISGILILILPMIKSNLIWYSMLINEILVAILGLIFLIIYNKKLNESLILK